MQDDTVHKPELPGVRTLEKDSGDEKPGFSFGGIKLTTPEQSDTVVDETIQHKGGSLAHGKEVFDVGRAFNDESVQEGTIVTDRKRKHASVGTLLKSAWGEWWGNTRSSVESTVGKIEFLKPKEEPTVEDATKRANILQEAAQYARQAPRDDHTIVVEKVRTYAHDAETVTGKPFTIKAPEVKVGAHWSKPREEPETNTPKKAEVIPELNLRETVIVPETKHASTPLSSYAPQVTAPVKKVEAPKVVVTVKPGIASMRIPEKMPGKVQPQKKSGWTFFKDEKPVAVDLRSAISAPRPEVTTVPRMEVKHALSVPRVREATPQPSVPVSQSIQEQKTSIQKTVTTAPVALESTGESVVRMRPIVETRPIIPESKGVLFTLTQIPQTLIIASIIVIGGGLGVLAALFILNTKEDMPAVQVTPVTIPSFLTTDTDVPVPLGTTRSVLYHVIENEMRVDHGGITHYYPTITEGDRTEPATTDAIMRTLAWGAPGSFVRALSPSMQFGSVRDSTSEPFIILHSTNFDVAFVGMLAWESSMSTDLTPLFGTPVTGRGFTDALTSNRSIRILTDDTGNERIVYAFVNRSLVIITTTTATLARIIERIQ